MLPKGHVHFDEATDKVHDDRSITIKSSGEGQYTIPLGFLQVLHHYQIRVTLPKEIFLNHSREDVFKAVEESQSNVYCKVISLEETVDSFVLTVEFFAHKEKVLKESIVVQFSDNSLKFIFVARVLGRGKGTPLLKDCIKCVGADPDDVSEASDWQGFD